MCSRVSKHIRLRTRLVASTSPLQAYLPKSPRGHSLSKCLDVVYFELLNPSETITGTLYRTHSMKSNRALKEKRPQYYSIHDKIILSQDNARPHAVFPLKNYFKTLNWEVLPHSSYSPDIAPSDYHLFLSLAHALSEQRFTSYEDTKNWVDLWIASKGKEFFRLSIRTLPERWKKVVASDGQYFDQN
ncbi:Mariner Mos1 transposase [Eumeta japonica]|uniref:Mariner Mos1 transposase n=1 Tax=Eumeta variegata TaxID=151549 RepID=A0A4C2A8I5_EUMVA|nr:Mariner Mos1 transposase [Eumeta japonica]